MRVSQHLMPHQYSAIHLSPPFKGVTPSCIFLSSLLPSDFPPSFLQYASFSYPNHIPSSDLRVRLPVQYIKFTDSKRYLLCWYRSNYITISLRIQLNEFDSYVVIWHHLIILLSNYHHWDGRTLKLDVIKGARKAVLAGIQHEMH